MSTARQYGLSAFAFVAALALMATLTLRASSAAFTSTDTNSPNSFAAGNVAITLDDTGTQLFNVSGLVPGDTVTDCIQVTYNGDVATSGVSLYSAGYTDSGTFADNLNVTIEEGTGGTFGNCASFTATSTEYSGTLTNFDTTHNTFASGVGTFAPSSAGETSSYRFTVELDPSTPNSQQGESVTGLGFTWEAQS